MPSSPSSISSSRSSSKNSSSAPASWYCWYSHQVIHVALRLSELHLIHPLPSVPVQECFPPEHSCELFADSLEYFLYSCGVSYEGSSHGKSSGRDITYSNLNIIRNPLDKV